MLEVGRARCNDRTFIRDRLAESDNYGIPLIVSITREILLLLADKRENKVQM